MMRLLSLFSCWDERRVLNLEEPLVVGRVYNGILNVSVSASEYQNERSG